MGRKRRGGGGGGAGAGGGGGAAQYHDNNRPATSLNPSTSTAFLSASPRRPANKKSTSTSTRKPPKPIAVAPSKAREFLGVGDEYPLKAAENVLAAERVRHELKLQKRRRKRTEEARPLPYAKALEIEAFFGKVAVSGAFSQGQF